MSQTYRHTPAEMYATRRSRLRIRASFRVFLLAGSALAPAGQAQAAQFAVTNGTTQTAPGPSYSATNTGTNSAALFANNPGSTINGTNLTLTSAMTAAGGAATQNSGVINLTGGTI